MDTLEVVRAQWSANDVNTIDGEALVIRLAVDRALGRRTEAPVAEPPLTLYGAYRQGIDDHFAHRPNPYRAGSRLWRIWEEGRIEAASSC